VAGATREEVVAVAREFLRESLADFQQRGQPWPAATRAVGLELLDVEEADVRTAMIPSQAR
jgi:hypothetical protein